VRPRLCRLPPTSTLAPYKIYDKLWVLRIWCANSQSSACVSKHHSCNSWRAWNIPRSGHCLVCTLDTASWTCFSTCRNPQNQVRNGGCKVVSGNLVDANEWYTSVIFKIAPVKKFMIHKVLEFKCAQKLPSSTLTLSNEASLISGPCVPNEDLLLLRH
jgi:hypothetical protein